MDYIYIHIIIKKCIVFCILCYNAGFGALGTLPLAKVLLEAMRQFTPVAWPAITAIFKQFILRCRVPQCEGHLPLCFGTKHLYSLTTVDHSVPSRGGQGVKMSGYHCVAHILVGRISLLGSPLHRTFSRVFLLS